MQRLWINFHSLFAIQLIKFNKNYKLATRIFSYILENCSTSIKVLGVMSRCYKVHSYSCKQSIYTKCVSEILQHRLTIIKEYWEAKLEMDL